jgi:hypothetical protein
MNRSGGISVVRVGLLAGVIGVILVILGAVAFFSDQASHRGPFDIPPFPGAEPWGTGEVTQTSRQLFYKVANATPDEVMQYFQQKLTQHTGNSQDHCIRNPPTGQAPTSPNVPSFIPFQYICLFDNSGYRSTQYTRVLIYPGTRNEDSFFNAEGQTVIMYEQHWQS